MEFIDQVTCKKTLVIILANLTLNVIAMKKLNFVVRKLNGTFVPSVLMCISNATACTILVKDCI